MDEAVDGDGDGAIAAFDGEYLFRLSAESANPPPAAATPLLPASFLAFPRRLPFSEATPRGVEVKPAE